MSAAAGLLTPGSSYSPYLPTRRAVACWAFVPGYSGRSVTAFHRLPYCLQYCETAAFHKYYSSMVKRQSIEVWLSCVSENLTSSLYIVFLK